MLVKIAKIIITVSNFSKAELIRYCSANGEKISVIYLGAEHLLSFPVDENIFEKYGIGNKPYILAVGNIAPNKNFDSIIQAIEFLDQVTFDVIVVGNSNIKIFRKNRITLNDRVKYLGYVNDSELRALYEGATCFIYPSFYEGFGIPPLEAMACGCPVIVANTASMPEVCGDAALYCDLQNPKELAEKIETFMKENTLREKQRQKVLEHVKGFTWKRCALSTIQVLNHLKQMED